MIKWVQIWFEGLIFKILNDLTQNKNFPFSAIDIISFDISDAAKSIFQHISKIILIFSWAV